MKIGKKMRTRNRDLITWSQPANTFMLRDTKLARLYKIKDEKFKTLAAVPFML